MGVVYEGRHLGTGRRVAIKVVEEGSDLSQSALRAEVQTQASLVHPSIVYLLDYGELELSLGERRPFVVMEFAEEGTLRSKPPMDWTELRSTLVQVLDALAFAHARGVIHRDLKPENLLLFKHHNVKLADFGIARKYGWKRDAESRHISAGTPHYMAPEQIVGKWRDYGPWTDIYALGCMVWEIVCGRTPFEGARLMEIVMAHLHNDRPPLASRMNVPAGLNAWVQRAMAIHPQERFHCAAEALRSLPGGEELGASSPVVGGLAPTLGWFLSTTPLELPTLEFAITSSQNVRLNRFSKSIPQILPEDWRVEMPSLEAGLQESGIGLFGIRDVPFEGRETERDVLWGTLKSTIDSQSVAAVILEGDPGSGKSRLSNWLAERALELGAATVFRATHTLGGSHPADGLLGMFRRSLNAWGESRDEFVSRLSHPDTTALSEILWAFEQSASERSYWDRLDNRLELYTRLLFRLSYNRPCIVVLDDVHLNTETLKWMQRLLSGTGPLMLIATHLPTSDLETNEVMEEIGMLHQHPNVESLRLEALSAQSHRQLVKSLLPLDDELSEQIASRTEGNPQFAMQIIADLIERDVLEVRESRYELAQNTQVRLPPTIQEVWEERLERLVGSYAEPDVFWSRLELAATLGREVGSLEWDAVCGIAEEGQRLQEDLIARGLARRMPAGWAFCHPLLVDTLISRSEEGGRAIQNHLQCAAILESLVPFSGDHGRIANHLIAAGDLELAWPFLEQEVYRLRRTQSASELQKIFSLQRLIADQIPLSSEDPRRLKAQGFELYYDLMFGEDATAMKPRLESFLLKAQRSADPILLAQASSTLCDCYVMLGDVTAGIKLGEEAVRYGRISGSHTALFNALETLSWIVHISGRSAESEVMIREARTLCEPMSYPYLVTSVLLAYVLGALSRFEEAQELLNEAIGGSQDKGFRVLESDAFNALGETFRYSDRPGPARECYEKALQIRQEMGRTEGLVGLNLLLIDLVEGLSNAAEARMDDLTKSLGASHQESFQFAQMILFAQRQEWHEFELKLAAMETSLRVSNRVERDYVWLIDVAIRFAEPHKKEDLVSRLQMLQDWVNAHLNGTGSGQQE